MADIKINGATPSAFYYGGTAASAVYYGATKLWEAAPAPVDPYNPLGLPAYTIRLKFTDGVTPSFSKGTAVQVSSSPNVWDLTYENADWSSLLSSKSDLAEVLGANTSSVTKMKMLFDSCTSLTSVPLFDTGSVTDMASMLYGCTSLTSVPLFDTGSVTYMNYMFYNCRNVASGSYALYQQASSQSTPPTNYGSCFRNCGVNTTTGAAELAQIPSSWGGTGS